MNEIEISDKLIALALEAGLSSEDLNTLLSGGGLIPDELKSYLEGIADCTQGAARGQDD